MTEPATEGNDLLIGSNGPDDIEALGGDDTVLALGGEDTLDGGEGADTLIGGAGADVMSGGGGRDSFVGYLADLNGDRITDYQFGEQLRLYDTLSDQAVIALQPSGSDTLLTIDSEGDGVVDAIVTLSGAVFGAVVLTSDFGSNNLIRIFDPAMSSSPTSGADLLVGTDTAETIFGLEGDDVIVGRGSDDTINGGAGSDELYGGAGIDIIEGGEGQDVIYGGSGMDFLTDTQTSGNYTIMFGGDGDDHLTTTTGNGYLEGGAGDDVITLSGTASASALGGSGNDIILGGQFNDWIDGGSGADLISGGGGQDYFAGYIADFDGDRITDFQWDDSFYFNDLSGYSSIQLQANGSETLLWLDGRADGSFETKVVLEGSLVGKLSLQGGVVGIVDPSGTVNLAPDGGNGVVALLEDETVTLTLLDFGFGDPDHDSLLAIHIVSAPSNGVIRVGGLAVAAGGAIAAGDLFAGRVTYTPNANASGADSVAFEVQDTGGVALGGQDLDGSANTLTLNIAPVNDAPIASGTAVLPTVAANSTPVGSTVADLFGPTFSDVDSGLGGIAIVGNASTYDQGSWQLSVDGQTWFPVNPGEPDLATFLGPAMLLRFVPATGFTGNPGGLSVRLMDDFWGVLTQIGSADPDINIADNRMSAGSVVLTTTVAQLNRPPSAPTLVQLSLSEDTAASRPIGSTDPDGDTLTYAIVAAPAHGILSLSGGSISYTPAANFNGTDSFTISISDGEFTIAQVVPVTVTPVNDAPTVTPTKTLAVREDTASASVPVGATDLDGDALSLSVSTAPLHGQVSLSGGAYTYTPQGNYNGSDRFILVISDGTAIVHQTVNVTVSPVNDAPIFQTPLSDAGGLQGSAMSISIAGATDPDHDVLTYSATLQSGAALPSWLTLTNGVLTGTPTGVEDLLSITVVASDPSGATASDTFDLFIGRNFVGGTGADRYVGGRGADVINGAKGNDELNGAAGADLIIGGLGNDTLTGGSGADTFAFGAKSGLDKITDFIVGLDRLQFDEGVTATGWTEQKGNTIVNLTGGGSITLIGVTGVHSLNELQFPLVDIP